MTCELKHLRIADVNVIPPSSGKNDGQVLFGKAKVGEQVLIYKPDELLLHPFQGSFIGHLLGALDMVGIKIEDKVGPKPILLCHCGSIRSLIVCCRMINMGRDLIHKEPLDALHVLESPVPLHEALAQEHESPFTFSEPGGKV